ncbi:uncharacterized protein LOC123509481 [Portunus trituberculatus]|uniref:uncharacterized protein LOC123509481 n=1 Tax=Portunus trituberculatus TaxID=210409 RepID=UPI001E1D10CE|nr:uncharacterized protein LOC123509481 [Portunus trituberculatus]XP_045119710.1 uncharacterized protein LOC123509481 [Portunus trituberculatus]
MEMEEAAKPKEPMEIQTFVFFDLETTGLAAGNPRIVELSMLAVSRDHLLAMKDSATPKPSDSSKFSSSQANGHSPTSNTDIQRKNPVPKLPRVIHKYTRLYYPWKVLTPQVEAINGLNNFDLEGLPSFDEASAQALSLFLDLPKPVTLVAHNGKRYDFPLLMAELNRVGYVDKFPDLQCIDSLTAIKDIDGLIEREDIANITKLAESFNIDDLDDSFMEEEPMPSKRQRSSECVEEKGRQGNLGPGQPLESVSCAGQGNHHNLEVSAAPLITPVKSRLPGQTHVPPTPSKLAAPPPQPTTPEALQPGVPGPSGFPAKVTKESRKVRRTLTYENNGKRKVGTRLSYAQVNIFKRLFDSEYAAHRAETDCEALMTICGHYGSKFVEWADTFATSFSTFNPMWVKRKSFDINPEG